MNLKNTFILGCAFACFSFVTSLNPSPGCGAPIPDTPHPGRHHRYDIVVGDPFQGEVTRSYVLHLPAHYDTSNTVATPLVLDYHGWTGTAHDQMVHMPWRDVADVDPVGFIYVTMEGMNDVAEGGWWGSWNVSSTEGPLGLTCDPSLHHDYPCYSSCGECGYQEGTCDWTSCYDDTTYTEYVLLEIYGKFCVDMDQIHMSGASNGGMFLWTRALAKWSTELASVAPVCSSPARGYNILPENPVNIIDFHGLNDRTIPFSADGPDNLGEGPDGTVIASDGFYYHDKMLHLTNVLNSMNCNMESQEYPTHMDGRHGFRCQLWNGCDNAKEVVQCNGNWTHDYPFSNRYIEGVMILWDFMKSHPIN